MPRVHFFSLLCHEMITHFAAKQATAANIPADAGIFAAEQDPFTFMIS
jgi:hypothetical protein